jgi:antitoxin (DNA-binding transcriptional repressor) of toxin-antitoxin stability system
MSTDTQIINTKQLRLELPRIMRRIAEGQRYLVLHRSSPAFEIIPPSSNPQQFPPLEEDPIMQLGSLGKSTDGVSSADHDKLLYGA